MRHERFTFLCNADERRILAILAQQLRRSQSDAIRFVLAEAVKALSEGNAAQSQPAALPAGTEPQPLGMQNGA